MESSKSRLNSFTALTLNVGYCATMTLLKHVLAEGSAGPTHPFTEMEKSSLDAVFARGRPAHDVAHVTNFRR